MSTEVTLTKDQKEAVKFFKQFIADPEQKEMILTGSPGTGKSFLIEYFSDKILKPYFDLQQSLDEYALAPTVFFTATTNKAAAVLSEFLQRPCETIHSFLNLQVIEDYETGEITLKRSPKSSVQQNKIIFIDECSMISKALWDYIHQLTYECKIIYIGDMYQLGPVKEKISPVFKHNLPIVELTTPVRNADNPALMELCEQFKETVRTGIFKPIKTVPGVIDWYDTDTFEREVQNCFKEPLLNQRLVAYSNRCVIGYNSYILNYRHATEFTVGENYVVASVYKTQNYKHLPIETECTISLLGPEDDIRFQNYVFRGHRATIKTKSFGLYEVVIVKNYLEVVGALKAYAKRKDWYNYFRLKEFILDLRPRDACTIHKVQGSTLDTVFVDLSDISRCTVKEEIARLLYVAFSRAKKRIVLCGKLKDAYGGPVICTTSTQS